MPAYTRMTRRLGIGAIEVLLASFLAATVLLPLYTSLQGSQRLAYLDEFHVVARQTALRTAAQLEGLSFEELEKNQLGPPEARLVPRLSGHARILPIPTEVDTLLELPAAGQEYYASRKRTMRTQAFFQVLEEGFGKLTVMVSWTDPTSKVLKEIYFVRLIEDPNRWTRN